MIRIIHLSDLHMHTSSNKPDNQNARRITEHILAQPPDTAAAKTYVLITGDLVDDASDAQYDQLKTDVLDPLAARFPVLSVPGNHDYALMGNVFRDEGPGRFRETVRDVSFPVVDTDSDGVVFIGLDSADAQNKVAFARGIVGSVQRKRLDAELDEHEQAFKVVYLHHHPFHRNFFVALDESEELLRVLAGRADLVLFGHKHVSEAFFDRFHVPVMVASGKVTKPEGPEENALAYRVIDIDTKAADPKNRMRIRTEEIKAAT